MSRSVAIIMGALSERRERIHTALASMELRHSFVVSGEAETAISRQEPDVVIIAGSSTDSWPEIECLRRLHTTFCHPKFLFLASSSSEDLAIEAFHSGAHRYLKEPWTASMLQSALRALLPVASPQSIRSDGLIGGERLVGDSAPMQRLRGHVARVAPAASNVLILGETGTGKELVAELLHLNGPRSSCPFVCLNTAAIPDSLMENELFGHERGAFTGATTSDVGKLGAADGGTVFLDEIGDVSLSIQAKLLRALENKSVYRLGGTRSVQFNVRVVAATNGDLERATAEGRFRKDLYYRLNVVRVEVPPLRERVEDIPCLVAHYLQHFNRELGRSVRGLSARSMESLSAYPWPGNVRELRNVIEALLVNLAPETTGVVDVPPEVMRQLALAVGAPTSERERLLRVLADTKWNRTKAAKELHISRMTLYRKMRRHRVGTSG